MIKITYTKESHVRASAEEVFAWHQQPAAFQRLQPPWEKVEVIHKEGGIQDGDRVTLKAYIGPFSTRWMVKHYDFIPPKQFCDLQVKGPFRYWKHIHGFRSQGDGTSYLRDTLNYALPFGLPGYLMGKRMIRRRLEKLFRFRHSITCNDLAHFASTRHLPRKRVLITGGNGMIGKALAAFLNTQGHEVHVLSRSGESTIQGCKGVLWDPAQKKVNVARLEGFDAVVHLAGANMAEGRWTEKRKKELVSSRVDGTRLLVESIQKLDIPPKCFISASGTGFYSNSLDTRFFESSPRGDGFVPDLCEQWENASRDLEQAGIRRVILRTGMVLSSRGGALAKMIPIIKAGLGGRLGGGRQLWSWIALSDHLRLIESAILNEEYIGVINAVAPEPVRSVDFTRLLAKLLRRPHVMPVPAFGLKVLKGQMAKDMLLASQGVMSDRLEELEFHHHYPSLEMALRHTLGMVEVEQDSSNGFVF